MTIHDPADDWVIYCRLSNNRDGKAANVKEQEADCRDYAEAHGLKVLAVYVDDGKSASDKSRARREDFTQMVADMKTGAFAGILASTLERLYRRPRELEDILDPVERFDVKVRIYTVDDDKEWKLDTPSGRKELRDYVTAAAWYSDDVAAKVRKKGKHRAREGRRNGGPAGYGYDYIPAVRGRDGRTIVEYERMTINDKQAAIVREIVARVLADKAQSPVIRDIVKRLGITAPQSIRSIANDLNRRGVPTRDGKAWHTGSMHRILTLPAMAGLIRHASLPELVPGQWDAIVPPDDWRTLQAVLANPDRRTNMLGNIRTALLSGMVYCGYPGCGQVLSATRDSRGKRVYTCRKEPNRPGCGKIRRQADPIDQLITEAVISALEDSDFTIPADDDDDFARLYAEKKRLEQDQAQLAIDHYRLRVIGRVPYLAANDALETDIAAVQRRLDRATSHRHVKEIPVGDIAQQEWDAHANDLAWRRELIGLFIERVIVKPSAFPRVPYSKHFGGRFDADSIDVIRRKRRD